MRRVMAALVGVGTFAVLSWLLAVESPVAQWAVPGGALVLLVAATIRGMRAPRGRRLRSALTPATDALEGAQDIYLGRPGIAPEYAGTPPVPTLIDDRDVPDLRPSAPGDGFGVVSPKGVTRKRPPGNAGALG